MRFVVLHRTTPHWEAGHLPGPELISGVGALIGEMLGAGVFVHAEGLRPSSLGVRLSFSGGRRRLTAGPFQASDMVASCFHLVRARSLDEAVEWMTRLGQVLGEVRIDLRPVTEPWDLGMAARPENLETQRYMALLHDPVAEAATPLAEERGAAQTRLMEEMRSAGILLTSVEMRPSARGARFRREGRGFAVSDGPFTETKELIAGYAMLQVSSRAEAVAWAHRYANVVGADELDLRELVE